ncbi:MAG TPA: PDZ domain-containing protein [Acidimicrobiales bacterium]|nr:PDZ domain-containing protein [Acidimicrobiales bacterium]
MSSPSPPTGPSEIRGSLLYPAGPLKMQSYETTLTVPEPTVSRKRRRWPFVSSAIVILLAVLVVVASRITLSEYALVPGDALSVSQLITLPKGQAHPLHGKLLLTDVGVNNVTLLGLIPAWLNSDTTLVSSNELTYGLPLSEFDGEGTVDMAESQLTAESVALRQLGYSVPEHDVGVTVYVIDPHSPAYRALQVGNVITALDGTPTPNPVALEKAVRAHKPGEQITLQVGSIAHPTPGHPVGLRLSSISEGHNTVPFIGIGDPAAPIAGLGTQPQYQFPFQVSINSDQIGGPSAGLAWTLGIVNGLSGGQLTGGRTVAATGTIDPDGSVGDVGGVEQKTVAVERAGASVFLVPDPEVATARSKATPGLEVMGVGSVSQALKDLQRLGGSLGSAALGPPAGPGGHSVPYDWQDSPWS